MHYAIMFYCEKRGSHLMRLVFELRAAKNYRKEYAKTALNAIPRRRIPFLSILIQCYSMRTLIIRIKAM